MLSAIDIKDLYKKYDVSASKRFGQNFLINPGVLQKIAEVALVNNKDVIEIGPGLGSLTHVLLEDANTVTSYEIDEDMIRVLEGEIKEDNFLLVKGDFLKAEMSWDGPKTLVANIPYYITSDILFKIFDNASKFDRCLLMMQEEVADRLVAKVGSKTYGKLTLTTKLFTENIKKEFVVSPGSFLPAPKVKSAVVSFDLRTKFDGDEKELKEFFKKMFSFRRKTLINNLKEVDIEPDVAKEILEEMNLKATARAQELDFEQFKELFKLVKKR